MLARCNPNFPILVNVRIIVRTAKMSKTALTVWDFTLSLEKSTDDQRAVIAQLERSYVEDDPDGLVENWSDADSETCSETDDEPGYLHWQGRISLIIRKR